MGKLYVQIGQILRFIRTNPFDSGLTVNLLIRFEWDCQLVTNKQGKSLILDGLRYTYEKRKKLE